MSSRMAPSAAISLSAKGIAHESEIRDRPRWATSEYHMRVIPHVADGVCEPAPLRREQLLIAGIVGACAALLALRGVGVVGISDFDNWWYAARAMAQGGNPYSVVGPGHAFDWPYPMFYPLPALFVVLPFAILPVGAAAAVFSGVSAFLLTCALLRDAPHRLAAVASYSFFFAVAISQWSPLLIAAALLPWLGALLVAKPSIGLALWLYRPRWQSAAIGFVLVLISLGVRPGWPGEWLATLKAADHMAPPVAHLGGPLILLALLRWRRPEARLLIAMACIPHTTLLYEDLPLFLIPSSWRQSILLAVLTWTAQGVNVWLGPYGALIDQTKTGGTVSVALCYLPCLLMVLSRPNVGTLPLWLDRSVGRLGTLLTVKSITR